MSIFDHDPIAAADEGAFCQLKHPVTEKPLFITDKDGVEDKSKPIGLVLRGADSPAFKRAVALNLAKQAKRKGVDISKLTNPELFKIQDEGEMNAVDLIVAITKDARNIIVNGAEISASKEDLRNLYANQPWVREQADEFFNDRANYLGNA